MFCTAKIEQDVCRVCILLVSSILEGLVEYWMSDSGQYAIYIVPSADSRATGIQGDQGIPANSLTMTWSSIW